VTFLVHDGARIVSAEDACVPVLDHGFLFGDSVYEVVRTARGRPFLMAEHMDRMRRSAEMIYFELPWRDDEIGARMGELIEALGCPDCYVRIIATRGPGPISLLPDGCDAPALYLIASELVRYPQEHYANGCSVAIVRRLRNDPRALDPRAKTGNYLNNMLGLIEARRAGADDALFLNIEDHLTEATTSNLWIVEGGRVLTPPLEAGLLAGITRGWVFRTLPGAGIDVAEEILHRRRLMRADEVFLTGTVKGIMPVGRVDGEAVPLGPVTARVSDLLCAALAGN